MELKDVNKKEGEEKFKPAPKPKKITKKDWKKVETWLKGELDSRKRSEHRTKAEAKWREIDRQIAMEAMVKINRDGSQADSGWHNVFELGELSKAAEDIKADVRRIVFPQSRAWFDVHSEIQTPFNQQTGAPQQDQGIQGKVDGRVRAFMQQQHNDFGFYDNVEISIGEALYHGSFVAEVRMRDQRLVYDGTKVKTRTAPSWVPHSMWNCYPDPSPSNIGTDMYYEGSMFIESYMPRHKAEQLVKSGEDGFMPSQWSKVSRDEHVVKSPSGDTRTKDVKLTTYWGDIVIERTDENLYFDNHKAVLMNGTIVYMAPNETPYPPLIFKGYERTDVRDPYYMSPIIKMSPMQKLSTILANKAMDGIELKLEPPIVYDGNDPDFVLNGGPDISPGSKTSTKGSNAFSQVEIGDPGVAVNFLQLCLGEMRDKLGRPMAKKSASDRKTKAEITKMDQDEEVSLVGFIDRMEEALRSFLYMQHHFNLTGVSEYTYYSPEMEDPDFLRMTREMLPKNCHFEVVGARGILGEEDRTQRMSMVTAFAAGNPIFAPLLDTKQILLQMYQDAGVKNPERLLSQMGNIPPGQLLGQLQQAKAMLQKLGGLLQQEKQKTAVKMEKIKADAMAKDTKQKSDAAMKHEKTMMDYKAKVEKMRQDYVLAVKEMGLGIRQDLMGHIAERDKHQREMHTRLVEGMMMKTGSPEQKEMLMSSVDETKESPLKAIAESMDKNASEIAAGQEKILAGQEKIADAMQMIASYLGAEKEVIREGGKIVGIRPRVSH